MKLRSFRIKNYKSIIDSGECILLDLDNITILAGQNESGKSSILQALRDYHDDELDIDAIRLENEIPEICCTYIIEENDYEALIKNLKQKVVIPTSIEKYLKSLKLISLTRSFTKSDNPTLFLEDNISKGIEQIKLEELKKIELIKAINDTENMKSNNKVIPSEENEENDDEIIDDDDVVDDDEAVEEEDIKESVTKKTTVKARTSETPIDISSEDFIWEITLSLDLLKPKIIFFDDFCDLLPDKILISDLVAKKKTSKGYQAVKNIETILNVDLTKLDTLGDPQRNKAQAQYHKTITANFNEKWTQKIDENHAKIHVKYEQGRAVNSSYLNFFIETKDEEYLPPRQRSQGFRWFLSFYLHLKAESERNQSLIILFDEPGLFLHSRAQKDMVAVFEELALKNQIIYTTHSPYLIDTSKLHRIKLVLNTEEHGTTIEKITTKKIKNQRDSLKPIIDAVGLEIAHNFSVTKKMNVILEGISDFYYLESFRILLNSKDEFAFVPAMGASNVHLLMELCIGWGLEWLIVFDEKGITKDYNKIKKNFFNNDETEASKKILKLKDFDGIEDLFDDSDVEKLLSDVEYKTGQKKGDFVGENGGKELIARLFLEKINEGHFSKEDFSEATLNNFTRIFDFVSEKFGFKK